MLYCFIVIALLLSIMMLLLYMDIGVTIIPAHSVLCHCSSSIVCIYLLLSKCVEIKG